MPENSIDRTRNRKPAVAAVRGKAVARDLIRLASSIDACCARMNAGLAAVAIMLAGAVVGTLMFRAPDLSFNPVNFEQASIVANSLY
jgi:hypothetical protein